MGLFALNIVEVVGIAVIYRRLRSTLGYIHTELHPNHGSSARDVLDRIELAAEQARIAAASARVASDTLTAAVSLAAEIAVQNRAQLKHLTGRVADAANLASGVADHLAAAQDRADEVDGVPGAAADAASQSARTGC